MIQQEQSNPAATAYRLGSLELVIALGCLALIIGIGIGVILNQSLQTASVSALPATAKPTRLPKATPRVKPAAAAAAAAPRVKPTAQASALPRRPKPTAQAAKPTSASVSAGPAPTSVPPRATPAPQAAVSTRPAAYVEYTVKKGDILNNLAKAHGVTVAEILSINTIKNPDSLSIGQVIRIPKK